MRSAPSPGDALPKNLENTHFSLRDLGNRIAMLNKRVIELERRIAHDPLVVITRPAGAVELESPRLTIPATNQILAVTLDVPSGTATKVRLYINGVDSRVSVSTAEVISDGHNIVLNPSDQVSFYCADLGFTLVAAVWN